MTNHSCEIEVSSDNAASLHMIWNDSETRNGLEKPAHQCEGTVDALKALVPVVYHIQEDLRLIED